MSTVHPALTPPIAGAKRLLLSPVDLEPTGPDWEIVSAFNPGVAVVGDRVVLLVRVAERPREERRGLIALPRFDFEKGYTVDWVRAEDVEPIDPRVVRLLSTGCIRLTFVSHLRVIDLGDGLARQSSDEIRIDPATFYEEYGVEDPRITKIDDRYWITYVAVSRHGVTTALASTTDFRTFERHGIQFTVENKDVLLFPEKIKNEYVALHRPNGATRFTVPEMWLAYSPDMLHWGKHAPLHVPLGDWESGRIGGGIPPFRVDGGWLEIYHGNRRPTKPGEVGAYQAAAVLLDSDDPSRVLARTHQPILSPTEPFERHGFVPDVVFPTGLVERGDNWLIYYGAGDAHTAVVEMHKSEILDHLRPVA